MTNPNTDRLQQIIARCSWRSDAAFLTGMLEALTDAALPDDAEGDHCNGHNLVQDNRFEAVARLADTVEAERWA